MSSSNTNTESQVEPAAEKAVVPKQKKLKPARKQVKPGDVDKETAPQTGKEYSACLADCPSSRSLYSFDGRHMVQQVGWR
jgi:heterodisulfide reductase subunit C